MSRLADRMEEGLTPNEAGAMVSLAISFKRIADSLEKIAENSKPPVYTIQPNIRDLKIGG